mmetsp:Transcript_14455/g.18356  ORF Transcript_14455/g.18356 Transcript_14455/m.18356 type:complete len:503 (-) Transcript_14455:249-1757(-)
MAPPPQPSREEIRAATRRNKRRSSGGNNEVNNNVIESNLSMCLWGWHPFILFILLTTSFVLSTMSSLDCQFVHVRGIYYDESSDTTADNIGVGLWSFEEWISDPKKQNKRNKKSEQEGNKVKAAQDWYNEMIKERRTTCVMYGTAYKRGGLAFRTRNGDSVVSEEEKDVYKQWLINGDVNWSLSRLAAIFGFISGLIANAAIWLMVCIGMKPMSKEAILYANIIAFICEAIKFAIFFNISFCHSFTNPTPTSTDWFDVGSESATTTTWDKMGQGGRIVRSCGFGRGSASSLSSTLLYFVAMVLILGYHLRPNNDDESDDLSIPMIFRTIRNRRNQNNVPSNSQRNLSTAIPNTERRRSGLEASGPTSSSLRHSKQPRRLPNQSAYDPSNSQRSLSRANAERRGSGLETSGPNSSSFRHLKQPRRSSDQSSKRPDNGNDPEKGEVKRQSSANSLEAVNAIDKDERGLKTGGQGRIIGRGKYVSRYVQCGDKSRTDISTLTGNS